MWTGYGRIYFLDKKELLSMPLEQSLQIHVILQKIIDIINCIGRMYISELPRYRYEIWHGRYFSNDKRIRRVMKKCRPFGDGIFVCKKGGIA